VPEIHFANKERLTNLYSIGDEVVIHDLYREREIMKIIHIHYKLTYKQCMQKVSLKVSLMFNIFLNKKSQK